MSGFSSAAPIEITPYRLGAGKYRTKFIGTQCGIFELIVKFIVILSVQPARSVGIRLDLIGCRPFKYQLSVDLKCGIWRRKHTSTVEARRGNIGETLRKPSLTQIGPLKLKSIIF